jgi:ribonuclease HII
MAILGIDEVGRGPLAGPLVVGAVVLPEPYPEWVNELKDSKKLTAKKRKALSEIILAEAVGTGLGWVTPAEIDELGIVGALRLATRKAIRELQEKNVKCSKIIIDGNINFLSGTKLEKITTTLIKGDNLIKEISAASIIAKVARDEYMIALGAEFPGYGFEKNVGYGTKAHIEAINTLGLTSEHRLSYEPVKVSPDLKKRIIRRIQQRLARKRKGKWRII